MKKLLVAFLCVVLLLGLLQAPSMAASVGAVVNTEAELEAKLADTSISEITIGSSFSITKAHSIQRPLSIVGGNNTLTLATSFADENMFNITSAVKISQLNFNGNHKGRIFKLSGTGFSLQNAVIENASTNTFAKKIGADGVNRQVYSGGAIYADHATFTLEDVVFESNYAHHNTPAPENPGDLAIAAHGGAVYSASSHITIIGGAFKNNYSGATSSSTGANGEGGAIKLEGGSTLTINAQNDSKRTIFEGNHNFRTEANVGGFQGGAIEATNSTVNINRTDFLVYGGFDTGGAIKFEGSGNKNKFNEINNSTFTLVGGKLPTVPVSSAYFGTSGGAIMSENSFVNVNNSEFTMKNSGAYPKVTYAGGHIDVVGAGEFHIDKTNFTGNGAGWNQGAVLNSAKYGGAIAFENGASAISTIKNSTFKNFTVDHTGGVISVGHREGISTGLGGTTVNLTLENTTLSGGRAYTWDGSAGAGMYIAQGANVVIHGGNINDMQANYGSAIYNMGNLTLDNKAVIQNNNTTHMAAGIYNNGYLNVHSAKLLNNAKTTDSFFAGGNHAFSTGEHSGGTIYAYKDVIIGAKAEFSTDARNDVRVINGKSTVILSGARTKQVNVSISEVESAGGTGVYNKGFDEPAHRHVGYQVARGLQAGDLTAAYKPGPTSYVATPEDAKNLHYVSNTVEAAKIAAFADHTGTGLWDYVFNPENKTVVLGQRAKMVYHSNHADATFESAEADTDPTGLKIDQVYTFYASGNNQNPRVSVNNIPKSDLSPIETKPALASFIFKDWYIPALKGLPRYAIDATPADTEKYDFVTKNTFTNTWHGAAPTGEVTDILDFASRNTLHTYAMYERELISIEVTKAWVGTPKASAGFKIYADNTELTDKALTLTAPEWKGTVTGLYKLDTTGKEIEYNVEETAIDGFTSSVNKTKEGNVLKFAFTNTIGGTVDIKVSKVWHGPKATATFQVLASGTPEAVAEVTLSAEPWEHTFTLPKYNATGNEIAYDIVENAIENYTSEKTGNATTGFTFTNTNTETIEVNISKIWEGPEKPATFHITADGRELAGKTVTLSAAPWKHTFTNLPKYNANGTAIVYDVTEDAIQGYTTSKTGTAAEGFVFTNKNTETTSVKVNKIWVGPSKPVTFIITADDVELQDKTVTLTQAPWEHTFTGLPKFNANGAEIDYNVIEDPIENYTVQSAGNATEGFTFTNTNTETVDVKVSKTWVGPQKPATFHITADGRELVDKTVTLNAAPWEHTFTNLPKYNANGTAIVYDVTEDEIPGYTTTRTGTAETGFVFNNSNVETVAIKVSKIWIGLPGKATFRLTADNEELTDRTVTLTQAPWEHTFTNLPKFKADGSLIEYNVTEDEVAGYELTNAGGNAVEGFSFTNSRIVGTTNLQISKLWKSATGTEISAPVDSVNVQVLRNGTLVQEIRLTKEQNFKATVENLPVEDIYGNPYIYTVQESNANNGKVSIQGVEYNVSVQGSLQTGFIISNAAPAPTPVPMVAAPKTGDTQNIWFLLFSLLGASVCILFIKRKRTN